MHRVKVNIRKFYWSPALRSDSKKFVKIGDVRVPLRKSIHSELIPAYYGFDKVPRNMLPHLKWLLQKDVLKQDVFLLGVPGTQRLELVLRYLEACNREFEYLAITRDTTESDIKQRREIRNGTAFYNDLCAVRAALNGRVLVIDGVERAERNVLPILNNLLENREMQLDDGRFLMKYDKYDELRTKYDEPTLKKMGMERVSEDFHVVALGTPVPRFAGNTLDPPFRSRFQCRNVDENSFQGTLEEATRIAKNVKESDVNDLVSLVFAYNTDISSSRPRIAISSLPRAFGIWNENPSYSTEDIIRILYPEKEILADADKHIMSEFKKKFQVASGGGSRKIVDSRPLDAKHQQITIQNGKEAQIDLKVVASKMESQEKAEDEIPWVKTNSQEELLADLAIAYSNGDFALIGAKGSGKTKIISELANRLRFDSETMVLHQDMNSRELVQRRHILANGDTVWEDSQLVQAARSGQVCILDGVDSVHPSVLFSLAQLISHRRMDLPDGNRLIGAEEFDLIIQRENCSETDLNSKGVYRIPESFRLVFVGESQNKENKWINEAVLALMPFYSVAKLTVNEQMSIIAKITSGTNKGSIENVVKFVQKVKESSDSGLKSMAASLSLRRLIHIARRDELRPGFLRSLVEKASLHKFLPMITKQAFEEELSKSKIFDIAGSVSDKGSSFLTSLRQELRAAGDEALVPNVLFHDNDHMARDLHLGFHLLLIGNQGVGKNKLTDRFLYLVNRPRQYMQLHRDTTVQTLTMQTVVENGVIRHEDSSLVKAARNGQILVIDEADKAPLHVIAILKNLLSTGTLVLGDGRRLCPKHMVSSMKGENIIPVDPGFRIIMLANRPGFPFLGNNLFAVLGDLFAIHMVDNPTRASEMEMLKKYGPNVPDSSLNMLLSAFNDLRDKADQGLLQYPYSTRELVNIVRHCEAFPKDALAKVVRNVFDFDAFNEDATKTVEEVFQKHGIPLGVDRNAEKVLVAQKFNIDEMRQIGEWSLDSSMMKGVAVTSTKPANSSVDFTHVLTVKKHVQNFAPIHWTELPLVKQHSRTLTFSEEMCYWKLPLLDVNIVSDGVRLKNDLIVATVNPIRLFVVKDFMQASTVQEMDISAWFPRQTPFKYHPRIKIATLDDSRILLHEETANVALMIDLDGPVGTNVNQKEKLSQQFEQMFSKSSKWRLTPPNGNPALLYERGGSRIQAFRFDATDGMLVEELTVPFEINRIVSIKQNDYLIIDSNASSHLLSRTNSGFEVIGLKKPTGKDFEPLAANVVVDEMLGVSDKFLILRGSYPKINVPSPVHGIERSEVENVVDKKRPFYLSDETCAQLLDPSKDVTFLDKVIVRSQPNWNVPDYALSKSVPMHLVAGFLEVVDYDRKNMCYIPIPAPREQSFYSEWIGAITKTKFLTVPWSDSTLLTIDSSGGIRAFELTSESIIKSFNEWKNLAGGDSGDLRMEFERGEDAFDLSKLDEPKLGKVDPNNAPHHGGNQWMGGTGGYNTAGLGGVGGPFRLDAGHDVHQMPESAKQKVPEHILKKAREIARAEYAKKLKEINMSEYDGDAYNQLWRNVESNSRKLSSVIEQLEAKRKEREWAKHQTSGDLDEGKLIEGITGENNIFRKRTDKVPEPGSPQVKPKLLKLCFDVSGSMYRFNGYDKRLQKSLEAALMMMTALDGRTDKVVYEITGHSGDSPDVRFVTEKSHPKNNKERLDVLKTMLAHTQYCVSGDNTVECLQTAVKKLSNSSEYDEMVVVLVSDANLERYGIDATELQKEMTRDAKINCFVVFIGSLGAQAENLVRQLPTGKAFMLKDTSDLPKIMETIFASTIAQ